MNSMEEVLRRAQRDKALIELSLHLHLHRQAIYLTKYSKLQIGDCLSAFWYIIENIILVAP